MWIAAMLAATPALAGTIQGVVLDATGAVLPDATVVVRDIGTGRETTASTGRDGRYEIETETTGSFLVVVRRQGFSEDAKTVLLESADATVELTFRLDVGALQSEVSVAAARGERETRRLPLHVETETGEAIARSNPLSTGSAIVSLANVTPVGDGPFGVRPRLRGLDSTRLLVLVDGERLNTARQATDRTGAEVGLVPVDAIDRVEVVNGAGTVLYGSDALAGTINIATMEPAFSATRAWQSGFNGFYSSNESGRRGTLSLGVSAPRYAVQIRGGAERFDDYRTGDFTVEDTGPLFASGQLRRSDTVDDAFGFAFGAFPDPFNAPFVRTDDVIPNSQARGRFVHGAALVAIGDRSTLKVRYQQRRMEDIGFPDFAAPYFFNATSLPYSRLDRTSAKIETRALTPWLARLSFSGHVQRTERLLENLLPVQFPAPTPSQFFPIAVMRLDILSETRQQVWTPGLDVQAVLTPATNHIVTAGLTAYQDRSRDQRTTTTTTSMVGQVVLGARGPSAVVFPRPVPLGPASVANPVRVPDATLTNVALFVQEEWRVRPALSVIAGLRGDFYRVRTDSTPGYDVSSVVAGATPAIDPATLPDPDGTRISRRALTGDVGLVGNPGGRLAPFVRIGRSYRHPNLEELLFAGPATVGQLAPNVLVKPETGTNVDAGARFRAGLVSGGAYAFVNQYRDFIAQDLVVAATPSGPLAQATNYADVRISGIELSADAPMAFRHGIVTVSGAAAFTRGTITNGINPIDGSSLDGTPADNITPAKVVAAARFTDARGRWWAEYGIRGQAKVDRIARTLLDSPFLIAQDLLSLDGFVIHRIGWGTEFGRGRDRLRVSFAVENLTNRFYREQFQFAPAQGRSFTVSVGVGSF
jgi:outer membrane receptor protein involved in Fe transport